MAPIRIVFFALAFLGLVASGWLLKQTAQMYEYHHENVERADKHQKDLKNFEFDKDGNVDPSKRDEFEMLLIDSKFDAESLRHSNEQISMGRTYSMIAIGATLLFAVLGLVLGRKKPAPPGQAAVM